MAIVAVYDPTRANALYSIGDDPGAVPSPFLKKLTAFSDGTPSGSPVDFSKYVWTAATQVFDLIPAPIPNADQATADTLIAKAASTWTNNDLAVAVRLLLKRFRGEL